MIGISKPRRDKWSCSSNPLILGMCTSNIKHPVLATDDDCRNPSADAKVRVANPSDLTRVSMAPRIQSSSSTIDMSGFSVNRSFHHRVDKGPPAPILRKSDSLYGDRSGLFGK
jgi:hypothetical protein